MKFSNTQKAVSYFCLSSYLCAASTIAFALSLTLFLRQRDKYSYYVHDFTNHFSLQPITDVLLNTDSCPSGYSPLYSGQWSGLSATETGSDGENSWTITVLVADPESLDKYNGRTLCYSTLGERFKDLPLPENDACP